MAGWNRTAAPVPAPPVHRLFEAQARRAPEALAVAAGGARLTYGELDARANALAHRLRRLGVGPESVVAVLLERSPELVIAVLATAKAGGAWLPIDPAYPAERIATMLRDSGAAALLTAGTAGHAGELPLAARAGAAAGRAARGARGAAGGPAPGSGPPRLRHLHLGLDRPAEGRRARATAGCPTWSPGTCAATRWRRRTARPCSPAPASTPRSGRSGRRSRPGPRSTCRPRATILSPAGAARLARGGGDHHCLPAHAPGRGRAGGDARAAGAAGPRAARRC